MTSCAGWGLPHGGLQSLRSFRTLPPYPASSAHADNLSPAGPSLSPWPRGASMTDGDSLPGGFSRCAPSVPSHRILRHPLPRITCLRRAPPSPHGRGGFSDGWGLPTGGLQSLRSFRTLPPYPASSAHADNLSPAGPSLSPWPRGASMTDGDSLPGGFSRCAPSVPSHRILRHPLRG